LKVIRKLLDWSKGDRPHERRWPDAHVVRSPTNTAAIAIHSGDVCQIYNTTLQARSIMRRDEALSTSAFMTPISEV
jgi:hypothetical protein